MATSSLEEKFRTMQRKIDGLDELCCARMKRTVKVEAEIRAVVKRMEDKDAFDCQGIIDRRQLRKWAVMLGCPDAESKDGQRISETEETKGPQGRT